MHEVGPILEGPNNQKHWNFCCEHSVSDLWYVLQRVAIKKQFFLAALQVQHPGTITSTNSSLNTPTPTAAPLSDPLQETSATSSFSRISVILAAPASTQETEGHVATGDNMRVFLEVKATVPLQFGSAHAVNTTTSDTHTLTVRPHCTCQNAAQSTLQWQ